MKPSKDISRVIQSIKTDIRDLEAEQTSRDFLTQLANADETSQVQDGIREVTSFSGGDVYATYGADDDGIGFLLMDD